MTNIAMEPAIKTATGPEWLSLMPGLFVVLWSTVFIGAKYGLPYAEPFTFLTLRFFLVAAIMLAASLAFGARWPARWRDVGHAALVGVLIQAIYLGGVFYAIAHGVAAGLAALIVGLQPLITASLVGILLGESVSARQWLRLPLGLLGPVPGLWGRLTFDLPHLAALAAVVAAPFGLTFRTPCQKRFCAAVDLRSATV